MEFKESARLYKEGQKHLVGAVNSPVRAFKSVGGNPLFIDRAEGSKIYDVDGNEYVDLVLSYGPMILGHGHPNVTKAVSDAAKKGYSFGASTVGEIELAAEVCNAFPGMDKVRFVNSGTEAVMSAIRLARAFTGKNKIVKFAGCYHGHSDALLVAAGSGLLTLSLPGSAGVPDAAVRNTLIAEYNNLASVEKHIADNADIAAIFIEAIPGNMGVVLPEEEFVAGLNRLCKENGILLVIDEVMTGYRSTYGGAQSLIGWNADITCLGKVIGGGMPVGAYGAREEIMQCVAPLGAMYQAGTLSGNPIAMAAGLSTLTTLKEQDPYEWFDFVGGEIEDALLDAGMKYGIPVTVNRFGAMINPFFTDKDVRTFADVQAADHELFGRFFWEMTKNGVYIPPSGYEAWFLSSAISEEDVKHIVKAIDASFAALKK